MAEQSEHPATRKSRVKVRRERPTFSVESESSQGEITIKPTGRAGFVGVAGLGLVVSVADLHKAIDLAAQECGEND